MKHRFSNAFNNLYRKFGPLEKAVFWIAAVVLTVSALTLTWFSAQAFTVEVPKHGGILREGVVGYPRFINPLLAVTDTGKDIGALIYSGLVRIDSNGKIVPDLAEKIDTSADGKTYTVTIRKNAVFHDGKPVTSEDVAYTILTAKDNSIKSPEGVKWQGVDVQTPNPQTVVFTLKEPFYPFIYNLTLGILPKHIWNNADTDEFTLSIYNLEPIGSGPYKFDSIIRDTNGLPSEYHIKAFKKAIGGEPYISEIVFTFYKTEDEMLRAYTEGKIDSMQGLSPEIALQNRSIIEGKNGVLIPLSQPRLFGVFFGQGNASLSPQLKVALSNVKFKQALSLSIRRQDLIDNALFSFGNIETGPFSSAFNPLIPIASFVGSTTASTTAPTLGSYNVEAAKNLLTEAGYVLNDEGKLTEKKSSEKVPSQISITLSTVSGTELERAGKIIQESWKALGIDVKLQTYEGEELNQKVIKNRNFDALLFGLVIPRSLDLYPFWHSSERKDPGVNISGYSNKNVDAALERIRKATTTDRTILQNDFRIVNDSITSELPTIFLFSPSYVYVIPKEMKGVYTGGILEPYNRFTNITESSIEQQRIWPIFNTFNQ